jgi:hypothetical protein
MLTQHAEGAWTVATRFKAPGLDIPLSMTVFRVPDGLVLYSPVPLAGDLPDQLSELGDVAHIIAPSRFHHLHVDKAQALFPQARSWGARGLKDKRKDLKLTELPDLSPIEGLDLVHIEGAPMLNEVCLHHVASDSVAICDLAFNMTDAAGWFGAVFTWMTGTNKGLAQSRSWHLFSREKQKTVASVGRLLDHDAQRVLMAHGEPLLERGTERLREALFLS